MAVLSAFASFTMQSWYVCSCFCHSLMVPMLLLKALALLESMKDEEARVRLDERKVKRHVYNDW